jgi:hypothetical protein
MMPAVFAEGERAAVEAAIEVAREALAPLDLWPAGVGGVHLPHRRAAAAAARGALRRKPSHAEIASATLEWARARGDVALYAVVAVGKAVERAKGPGGLSEAAEAHPPLAASQALFEDLVGHLTESLPRLASVGREK